MRGTIAYLAAGHHTSDLIREADRDRRSAAFQSRRRRPAELRRPEWITRLLAGKRPVRVRTGRQSV